MPSINIDLEYPGQLRTVRLIGLLGKGAEILPIRLWIYCGKFSAETGRLTGHTAQEIEAAVSWWGKPGALIPAMITAEFLGHDQQGFYVRNWNLEQGHIAKYAKKGRAMAEARWGKPEDNPPPPPPNSNAHSIPASNTQTYTQQYQSKAEQSRTKKLTTKAAPEKGLASSTTGSPPGTSPPIHHQSSILDPQRRLTRPQRQLAQHCEQLLGPQWVNDAGKWVNRITGRGDLQNGHAEPDKVRRIMAEVQSAITESRIKTTPAQYAEQLWSEFK